MRILSVMVFCLGMLLASGPALAQDGDAARRLQLAEQYIEVSLGSNLGKMVSQMVEDQLAEDVGMGERERQWSRANMPGLIIDMIEGMAEDLAPLYAEAYTIAELEALIAFYSTPMGQSIANKEFALAAQSEPIMVEAVNGFMVNLITKYCAEFDCEGAPGPGGVKN